MKENFPNLAKEIDFQEVQEAQSLPKKLDPRRNTPRHKCQGLKLKRESYKQQKKRRELPAMQSP